MCVPNKVKNMNVKVMLSVNEKWFYVQYDSCEYKCRLNGDVCKSKQKWEHDKCRCKCKKLDKWGSYKDDYMLNPSTCYCMTVIKQIKLLNI